MDSETEKKRERWLNRIQNLRRDYFYQRWSDRTGESGVDLLLLLKWIYHDLSFLVRWNINLLLQLKHYGAEIKKYSGLSYYGQWKRMAYIVFKMRSSSSMLRYNHLFEQGRWEDVELYSHMRHNTIAKRLDGFYPEADMTRLHNKLEFYKYCLKYDWNTPKIYAVYKDGVRIWSEKQAISYPKKNLFVKNLDSGRGRGAKYLYYKNGYYQDLKGEQFDQKSLNSYLERESQRHDNLLVQEAKKNHAEWEKFTNGSLASCRIVTGRSLKDKHEIIPFFATFKMPVGDANGDNFSMGGFGSAINIDTGELGKAFSSKPYKNTFSWDTHPETGEKVTGSFLYRWGDVLEFTKEIHRKCKVLAIGWDVTLTEEGVCIIEGNPYWGADVVETPSKTPITRTDYPIWIEDCIELLSQKSVDELLKDE